MSARALRGDAAAAAALTLLAGAVRAVFVALQGVPRFDPWRHLVLIRNLRQGAGFTLYANQPYIWYAPFWHWLAARAPAWLAPDALAALFSVAVTPLLYLMARRASPGSRGPALVAAAVWAVSGPMVAFTCHYGSEACAVFALLAGLALAGADRRVASALAAGAAVGFALALRLNLAFTALLAVPLLRAPARFAGFALGAAAPLFWVWWWNHQAIAAAPFVFVWDGLAARSADFDLLSTFVIQRQPDVAEALRRMHQAVVPDFEWLWGRGGVPLGPLSFMLSGFAALALCGDAWLAASGLATALYLGFADATLSSHWFRLWLGIFPPFCLAAGQVAQRAARSRSRARRAGAALLVLLLGFGAFGWLQPAPEIALERVTPPPELLQDSAYLVTSAFYPESLSYRFPDKRFIGMPLHASEFAEFAAAFPGYDAVLWKSIGIQSELIDALTLRDGYALAGAATNRYGVKWAVLKKPESR